MNWHCELCEVPDSEPCVYCPLNGRAHPAKVEEIKPIGKTHNGKTAKRTR